jgi:hypothetical protein
MWWKVVFSGLELDADLDYCAASLQKFLPRAKPAEIQTEDTEYCSIASKQSEYRDSERLDWGFLHSPAGACVPRYVALRGKLGLAAVQRTVGISGPFVSSPYLDQTRSKHHYGHDACTWLIE